MKQEMLEPEKMLDKMLAPLPSLGSAAGWSLASFSPSCPPPPSPRQRLLLSAPPESSKPGHRGPECQRKTSKPRVLLQTDLLLAL